MQLEIIKQGISRSFIFQNQHTYYDAQKSLRDTNVFSSISNAEKTSWVFEFLQKEA